MQFDSSQTGTKDIGLRIFRDAGGVPGEAVFWGTVTVTDPTDVYPLWREVIVDGQPGVHGINGDFWVWLEVLDTNPNQRFPQILGDDAEPWLGANHYFTYRRGDTLVPQPYFFFVRALVTEGTSESPVQELAPVTYSLNQNYPNPFNPVTEINYSIARTEKVSLRVFNLLGQEVAVLVDGVKSAGVHKVSFNGSQLPSGIYMYRLETDSHTLSKKMVLMK
ncbi:MAG: T9SS type A sorting domain-containing protein [Calditrichaeota bacterium]|nr:T9SS type A sorting domain-containing protein [Calditrichota bacterium]